MKAYLIMMKKKINLYTERTLKMMCQRSGIELVLDPSEADLILVSVDDPDDLPLVKKANILAKKREHPIPLIAGGFEGFGGEYLLAYCDAVNVGEGYEFFAKLGTLKHPEDIYDEPYVLTRDKQIVYPSYRIDTESLPLVRTGKRAWYYLAGRGCRGKCMFCETSYAYPKWHNFPSNLEKAINHVESMHHNLTFITNDSSELKGITSSRIVQSVRVDDFIKEPSRFAGANMLHFGIEGWTEEQRKWYAKPITNEKIYHLVELLQEYKQPAEFFFITGLPGTFDLMMEFAQQMPLRPQPYPRIFIKLTRLDPSPQTPLWSYDLTKLDLLSRKMVKDFMNELSARNKGFRIFPVRGDAKHVFRPILRHCSPDELPMIGKEPEGNTEQASYFDFIYSQGLGHLITYDGRPMASSQIVTPWREMRDRMALSHGMTPINYKSQGAIILRDFPPFSLHSAELLEASGPLDQTSVR